MDNPFSQIEKRFSIGVPFYGDHTEDFAKFFKAINESDYKNFEVVVTFDGENPKGVKALQKEIKKYPDVEVKYQTIEHGGCTVARNACVDLFTGDYYSFSGSDYMYYPETLRMWANAFEDPKVNRVWGLYDIVNEDGTVLSSVGQVPMVGGKVAYEAFKYSPYCDAAMPIRKESYIPWDPDCKSLNDWELSVRMLKRDNFKGEDWLYIPHHFFAAEAPRAGGLSNDSHSNWEERKHYIMEKNGIPESDICVTSLGAINHALPVAKMLGAELLTMPSFKKHHYKMVYLLGFYTREDPSNPGFVTRSHMDVFKGNKGKNIIHWIGTDIYDLFHSDSFAKLKELREWFKDNKVVHLCEADFTQKELKEVGIDAQIVPIPPSKQFKPMPLPDKFTIGVYLPPNQQGTYSEDFVMEITRAMPDIQFYFFGNENRKGEKGNNWEHLGYINFDEWMPNFSCELRLTVHDGLPLSSVQFMQAGRNVVTNVPVKGAIHVHPTRKNIVEGIRKAQKTPLNKSTSDYWTKEMSVDKYKKSIEELK